jgi:hypothetical protein
MTRNEVQAPALAGAGGTKAKTGPTLHAPLAPVNTQALAEQIVGPIAWQTTTTGFCECPGIGLHNSPNGPRDCAIYLAGVPSLHCQHSSCADAIADANHALRSACARAEYVGGSAIPRPRQTDPAHQEKKHLAARALASRAAILADPRFQRSLPDLWEESPVRLLGDAESDWRVFLRLFGPNDLLWIGDRRESGPGFENHFRTAKEWLQQPAAPGPLIAPCVFKPGTVSRSKQNIERQDFLVVESDELDEAQQLAVIQWLRLFMDLRALVFSGRRSYHAWFTWPAPAVLEQLQAILPALGVDPASLRQGHCSRAPSFTRQETEKFQSLYYLAA